jgi:hypothetical protein
MYRALPGILFGLLLGSAICSSPQTTLPSQAGHALSAALSTSSVPCASEVDEPVIYLGFKSKGLLQDNELARMLDKIKPAAAPFANALSDTNAFACRLDGDARSPVATCLISPCCLLI